MDVNGRIRTAKGRRACPCEGPRSLAGGLSKPKCWPADQPDGWARRCGEAFPAARASYVRSVTSPDVVPVAAAVSPSPARDGMTSMWADLFAREATPVSRASAARPHGAQRARRAANVSIGGHWRSARGASRRSVRLVLEPLFLLGCGLRSVPQQTATPGRFRPDDAGAGPRPSSVCAGPHAMNQ